MGLSHLNHLNTTKEVEPGMVNTLNKLSSAPSYGIIYSTQTLLLWHLVGLCHKMSSRLPPPPHCHYKKRRIRQTVSGNSSKNVTTNAEISAPRKRTALEHAALKSNDKIIIIHFICITLFTKLFTGPLNDNNKKKTVHRKLSANGNARYIKMTGKQTDPKNSRLEIWDAAARSTPRYPRDPFLSALGGGGAEAAPESRRRLISIFPI